MGIEKCRLCCASKALISVTCGKSRKERDYIRKLTEITTGIKFQKNDASRYICVFCMATIYNFHVFKIKSLRNEELLQSCIASPPKSTKKLKVHIPDLCEIELPSVEDLKTELFEWLKNKIDIMEKDEIENQHNIDFDQSSSVSTQVDTPTIVMIDVQTQVEAPHTYNVSCQYSVKTTDEKIQCSIRPVCHDKLSQTMKQSCEIKENASQCNLYERASVSIGVQSSPVSNELPSHSSNATVSATKEHVETSSSVDQVSSVVNQKNGSISERQNEIGENVREKSSSPRRRFSTRNKNNSPSTASLMNGLLAVAMPSVANSQTLVLNESVTKPTVATAIYSCDKIDSTIQSLGSIGDTTLTRNRRKRKLSTSLEGATLSNEKMQRKKVSRLGRPKNRISMPLPISSIKTEVPSEDHEDEVVEPQHTEMKFESGDTQLEPLEISTEALLYEIDTFLTPGTIKEECSPSTPNSSTLQSKHNKTLSPSFKYDSPRSSRLLAVKDKVQFVKICKECDQPMYSEHERAKHRKSHMRCHLCQKVFTSLKKTKLHVSLECDKKISKLVPMVYLDRMDVSTLCAFSDEGSSSDLMPLSCDDGVC